jgi:enoyl-CoA hydratase/carnithine racemase
VTADLPGGGVESKLSGHVWHVRLQRSRKRNALTMKMFADLADSLGMAASDPTVRAIAMTGDGPNFCAGHDLDDFRHWPQQPGDPVPRFLHALADVRKPLVVGVHGSAAGIGVTMLLHADWVISTRDAILLLPFVNLGIAPEAASSMLLARAVGSVRARQLLLGGEPFRGEDAERWGLVSELAEPDDLAHRVLQRAEVLAQKDPQTLLRIKAWMVPGAEANRRIDEEVDAINQAVNRQRKVTPSNERP